MSLLLGTEVGLERIARDTTLILASDLNAQIKAEHDKWAALDQEVATKLNIQYVPCNFIPVQSSNFVVGHRPSLIEAPVDRYPNVCAMAYNSTPSHDVGDFYEGHMIDMYIEAMVTEGPFTQTPDGSFERQAEDLVNRRVQRMAEAIHAVMMRYPSLLGIVEEITRPPQIMISDAFRRRGDKGYGGDYYWQMVRLEYKINKVSTF